MLDLSSLINANQSLKAAIIEYNKDKANEFVRDSVIQRFEYTYELSVKSIKRYLEMILPNSTEVDNYTYNELIRKANEKGILLNNLEKWTIYRAKRNITSHTYDINKALNVIEITDDFNKEVNYLIKKLKNE